MGKVWIGYSVEDVGRATWLEELSIGCLNITAKSWLVNIFVRILHVYSIKDIGQMSDNWPENVFFLEIGKITLLFHIFGICNKERQALYMCVRSRSAECGKCLSISLVIICGPGALFRNAAIICCCTSVSVMGRVTSSYQ